MATGIAQLSCRAQATRAQPFTSTHIGQPRPIVFATVQYFIQIPHVWFFWVRRHVPVILQEKNGNMRNSRKFVKIWTIEKFNWSQKRLGFPPNSLWKVLLKFFFFLQVNPINTNEKKQLLNISSSRIQSFEEKNKDKFIERKFQDKGPEAQCREKPLKLNPGSNLRHQIA